MSDVPADFFLIICRPNPIRRPAIQVFGGKYMPTQKMEEKRRDIGAKGSETEHICSGKDCTDPSHRKESIHTGGSSGSSTSEKRSETGAKGTEAHSTEDKKKGGEHSHGGSK
jgi:hypothetical protein